MDETERSTVASAIETQKNNMFSPINTFLEECGVNVTLTPLTLTTANVSSNADENTGGGYTDGGGIAALFDLTDAGQPNTGSYFHSRWSGTAVNEYHYIQVDAGEAISAFTFGYSTRNGGEQHPTSMRVLGSTDGTNYTLIADIDKENFGMDSFRIITDHLKNGEVVSMFPEGHVNTDADNGLDQFKSGMVLMSVMSEKPIVPVYIHKREHIYNRTKIAIGEPVDIVALHGARPSMTQIEETAAMLREREQELEKLITGGKKNAFTK